MVNRDYDNPAVYIAKLEAKNKELYDALDMLCRFTGVQIEDCLEDDPYLIAYEKAIEVLRGGVGDD